MQEKSELPSFALPRKHHDIVTGAVNRWRERGVIDAETGTRLMDSISIAPFDWQRMARYAFIVAIVCLVIAVSAVVADKVLMALLMRIFNAPAAGKSAFFASVTAVIFAYGVFLRKKHPHRIYSNEAVFFLGVLTLAVSIYFVGFAIDVGTGRYAVLFLIASVLYVLLGLWFPSALVWVFGLLSLGAWMGAKTGYASGHGMYFLGMNYPLRFVIFGGALAILGVAGEHAASRLNGAGIKGQLLSMAPQTKVVGLLYLFIALWIMSIFGNYADMVQWQNARQYELLHWSLLFGAASLLAMWYGLKHDDGVLRGFGLTFLVINLYTRFFEYFWDSVHKAVFFAVLAASFWYLGSRAEAIWRLGGRTQQPNGGE